MRISAYIWITLQCNFDRNFNSLDEALNNFIRRPLESAGQFQLDFRENIFRTDPVVVSLRKLLSHRDERLSGLFLRDKKAVICSSNERSHLSCGSEIFCCRKT
ncbi:hypothetical protein DAI18_15400 [Microvirgula aerodenitrificans]|uniref:Uncharacterized protein n=1 Tax=Microvirgula aerodenitrificans TaxID=57480 RepID=A0A2S0PD00_9NEIS|nr:hypothetical protein DAI18_15400 [Microvirgula aerodenitrificans]